MGDLIARTSILYQAKMYAAGDILPQHDHVMVKAWVDAGSAAYAEKETVKEEPIESETPASKRRVKK